MGQFDSRNTPITVTNGFRRFTLPATSDTMVALIPIPHGANAALLQGDGDASFGYRMDAAVGAPAIASLTASRVYLSNREEINKIAVVANGGAARVVVQFFTGRTGPAYR